jgi:hypothetical protein
MKCKYCDKTYLHSHYSKEPMPTKSVREQIDELMRKVVGGSWFSYQTEQILALAISEIKKVVNPYKQKPAYESISETNIPRMLQERAFESARQAIIEKLEEAKHG